MFTPAFQVLSDQVPWSADLAIANVQQLASSMHRPKTLLAVASNPDLG
jgi:hypothetical protein